MSSKKPLAPWCALSRTELDQLVREDRSLLLEALSSLRKRRAKGRFSELDRLLGLSRGTLTRVFRGDKTLDDRRLLKLIRLLGEEPEALFARAFARRYRQPSPIGLLPRLIERDPRSEPPPWRDRLLKWARSLEISATGKPFDFDPNELLELRQQNLQSAEQTGIAALEYLVASSDKGLATLSAVPLARWVSDLAYMHRLRGDRYTSAELFDLAFRLEASVGDDSCRSFVYRNASYLLSDWGHLAEAERFAQAAVDFANAAGDLEGLALSNYAHATALLYLGESDLALRAYRSSRNFLQPGQIELVACVSQAITLLHLEQRSTAEARVAVQVMDRSPEASISLPSRARFALTRAELASQLGDTEEAQQHFEKSLSLFEECGSIAELVMVSLFIVRHLVRHHRLEQVRPWASALLDHSNDPNLDKTGQAILLEIARLCFRGEVTASALSDFIKDWHKVMPRAVARGNLI